MSEHPSAPGSAGQDGIRKHLRYEHELVDQALSDLAGAADGGDLSELQGAWAELESLLLRHLTFEETELFPAVEAVHPDWTQGLRQDHARIRAVLAEFGVRLELHALKKLELDEFSELLRAHAEREDATMYRWAEEAPPVDTRRHLLRLLLRTQAKDLRSLRESS